MADDGDSENGRGALLRRRADLLGGVRSRLRKRGSGQKESADRTQRCCTSLIHVCEPLSSTSATSGPARWSRLFAFNS